MYKIFTYKGSRFGLTETEFEAFKTTFLAYKKDNILPPIFGRDASYTRPPSAKENQLMHLHLSDSFHGEQLDGWSEYLTQYKRTSNTFLIYCSGIMYPKYYLLIAILQPKAHDKSEDMLFMSQLSEIAGNFRMKY